MKPNLLSQYYGAALVTAEEATDDDLREWGCSNHDLLRVRTMPKDEMLRTIAEKYIEFLLRRVE